MTKPRPLKTLLVYAASERNATLAYQHGWPRHVYAHPAFDCVPLNLLDPRFAARVLRAVAWRRSQFDVVVLLHSVFSNERHMGVRLASRLRALPARKVLFLGNEYKLMPEKLQLCEELDVSLLVSQLSSPEARSLYRVRLGCDVIGIPSAGLDTEIFRAVVPRESRPIELGYRGYENAMYLGHVERRELVERFADAAGRLGIKADLSLDPADRLDERGWSRFLNQCRAQLGSSAGGDFFELTDETRVAVNRYLGERPDASFDEIALKFFRSYGRSISGRALSGRIVEAAATDTAQVLLAGDYGFFEPDVHYISVRPDFANVDESIAMLRDDAFCRPMVEAAKRVALEEYRYERLIDQLHKALTGAP